MTKQDKQLIKAASRALSDWIVIINPDFYSKAYVQEVRNRIRDGGGTTAYATDLVERLDRLVSGR